MKDRASIALVVSLSLAPLPASARAATAASHFLTHNPCPIFLYNKADASLGRAAGSWPSLFEHHRMFGSCDDGALAEGYSDAVVTLFAHRWRQFDVFVSFSKRHPAFQRWAIQHIDASAADDDLKRVRRNTDRCVGDLKRISLCKAVGEAAAGALME